MTSSRNFLFYMLALVWVIPSAPIWGQEQQADRPSASEPSPQEWKEYPGAWLKWHEKFLGEAKGSNAQVVFFGDSLTQGWDSEVWKEKIAPLQALNFGIGGDRTHHLLYRIRNGELDEIEPKVIVMMIGINNIWGSYQADETADGILANVKAVRELKPKAQIILIPVLPVNVAKHPDRTWVSQVNQRTLKLVADQENLTVLDLTSDFLESDGELKQGFYTDDKVHFQKAAYEAMANRLVPVITELLEHK